MKKMYFFIFILLVSQVYSQSNLADFWKLSRPKKTWVIFHPFKAKKALRVSNEVRRVSDSILIKGTLKEGRSGGQIDAFRHAFWMARLSQEIGISAARSLGKAHEKENYLMYKNNKLEDGVVPDKISSDMDLYNNEVGLGLFPSKNKFSKSYLIKEIIKHIKNGDFKVVKRDKKGFYLTCNGSKIAKDSLLGKWENNKCLTDSSFFN